MLNFGFAVLIYTAGPPGMLWESEPGVSGWVFRSDGILFSPSLERFNFVKTNKNISNLSPRRKMLENMTLKGKTSPNFSLSQDT